MGISEQKSRRIWKIQILRLFCLQNLKSPAAMPAGSAAPGASALPAAGEGLAAPVKEPLKAHLNRHNQQRQHDEHQPGGKTQRRQGENLSVEDHGNQQPHCHGDQQHPALDVQRPGGVVDHQNAVDGHEDHADGGELPQGQVEGIDKELRKEDDDNGREPSREGPAEHVVQKLPPHQVVIGLQGQEEGGDADGEGGDQRQLNRHQGIRERRKQRDEGQEEGQDVLHQIQR